MSQMGIICEADADGKLYLALEVAAEAASVKVYLARSENYEEVAKSLYDGICKAGLEMWRHEHGIVVAEAGDINGIHLPAERRAFVPRKNGKGAAK